jgi:hypothetical protein
MATSLQIQTLELVPPADPQISPTVDQSDSHWLDRTASPREEARILFEMLGRNGDTRRRGVRTTASCKFGIKDAVHLNFR